jgi:DNA polymerase-3 subunit gamma/tau
MSHQVLARKWRPKSFAQLVGQEHVVRALSNALASGRLHHAYLFTGTRGVGKTTLARILARCLNCEAGVSAEPCGECPACQQIDAGRFVDLIELDAASNTGVDNMREILENAQYAPTSGRYKVYIIDEVHMLSKSAFNAMLKTLEEPPAHIIFILATTDPQKVPVTVLSRCLQFNLKQMPPGHVAGHLKKVLEAEAVPFEHGALSLLARAAAGSMRDALSLTDQAIAYGSGSVKEDDTRTMLGVIDAAYLMPVLEALAGQDGPALMREADELAARGFSFDAALQDLATLLHQIALAQTVPEAVSEDAPERERLFELAQKIDAESVQLWYQIATLGRRDLEWAPDEYAGFSMTLLRMLAFAPGEPPPARATPPAPATRNEVRRASPASAALAASRVQPVAQAANEASIEAPIEQPVEKRGEPQAGLPTDLPPSSSRGETISLDWYAEAERLPGLVRQLALQCELAGWDGQTLCLTLAEDQKPLLMSFGDKFKAALAERFGKAARIDIRFAAAANSPAAQKSRAREARQAEAEAAIAADPFVQTLVRECAATVQKIRPLTGTGN